MGTEFPPIAVAGHICLDIIPGVAEGSGGLPGPGEVVAAGPAVVSTGGVVSNTGLALHRLGVPAVLMGKVGDDVLGRAVLDFLGGHAKRLAEGMAIAPGEPTSYTVVISPPGRDRGFLHCPGVNDTFTADDVDLAKLGGAGLLHFGYPPLMRRMYRDNGAETARLFEKAKAAGLTTSLDMAVPDPASEAGRTDWRAFFQAVLPHVDLLLPSLDEMRSMMGLAANAPMDGPVLDRMADELLGFGATLVGLKLGESGFYLRTPKDAGAFSRLGRCAPPEPRAWAGRTLIAPCFGVKALGTTGAGDVTVAGFLAGFSLGLGPEEVLISATAVGAHGVEAPDSTSGVPPWEQVHARVQAGWARRDMGLALPGWRPSATGALWLGPDDPGA